MNINFIINEPASEYHARSRSGEFMSSHLLADFRESPALYRKKVTGEIEDKDSSAFVIGRAAHCLILEGRKAFDRDYVVSDGPINPRTGEAYGRTTKAFTEWAATQDREVISGKDFGFISQLQTCGSLGKIKIQKNPAIKDWIAGHNIVRIALYCKRINSHFPFSHHPSHKVLWMTGHTERKRSASYRNEMACRGVMK